ncbi:MAG: DUF2064 domain-containing protein [Flavitalea sp.]
MFDETRQTGNTFSERLLSAIDYGFIKGHNRLIVIGNDCIQLTEQEILIASDKLISNDFVIGPTHNGGLYLIGLTENTPYANLISNVKWQTGTVADSAKSFLCASAAGYFLLPTLSDFNDINDYVFLKARVSVFNPLLILIKSVLTSYSLLVYLIRDLSLQSIDLSAEQLRGPPARSYIPLT